MRSLLALCALVPLSGCFVSRAHENRPLAAAAFATLTVGTSTATDATAALGAPSQVVELGTGSAWLYQYAQSKRAGLFLLIVGFLNEDAQSDRIWLFFDQAGVLRNAAATFDADSAQWEMPWGDANS